MVLTPNSGVGARVMTNKNKPLQQQTSTTNNVSSILEVNVKHLPLILHSTEGEPMNAISHFVFVLLSHIILGIGKALAMK